MGGVECWVCTCMFVYAHIKCITVYSFCATPVAIVSLKFFPVLFVILKLQPSCPAAQKKLGAAHSSLSI